MNYIVFDLEWNQACFCNASVRKKLGRFPFRLNGEIIQIGAVRLNRQSVIIDEFKIGIKPQFFSVMDKKIMHLTGIDQAMLQAGVDFASALRQFEVWCGEAAVFFAWGPDDAEILRQNLQVHEIEDVFSARCFDLQKIFNMQVESASCKQISLKKAVEHFQIDQSRVAHDALNDAYDAACVSQYLDLPKGMEACAKILPEDVWEGAVGRSADVFQKISSKEEALRKIKLMRLCCPECGRRMQNEKMIKWKRGQYLLLSHCVRHGVFFIRIKLEKDYRYSWTIRRDLYVADAKMIAFYRMEAKKRAVKESEKLVSADGGVHDETGQSMVAGAAKKTDWMEQGYGIEK